MICLTCANAADRQLGEEAHCDATGGPDAQCTCQHRTDRYQRPALAVPEQPTVVIHVHHDPVRLQGAIRDVRRNTTKETDRA
ncbi:hypothetical protein ACIOC2_19180 [Streptomyces sp. NPDC088337]|uniref:hypothetical protein n=1 Tax=unclassified Streptomyces TaxID=2593676 RepID=UPI0037FEFC48